MKYRYALAIGLCFALLATLGTSLALAAFDGPRADGGIAPAAAVPTPLADPGKPRTAKKIALTFDDGYNSKNVNRVLDILAHEHVHATFFPVASWVHRDPATFRRMAAQHEIGNHTVSHPFLTRLSNAGVRREILGGVASPLFRPPYGDINGRVRVIVRALGLHLVMWDVDSRDWTGIPPARLTANVVNQAGAGKIVLMHMGDWNTVEALPQIIAQLRARGYTFVTVSELGKAGTSS